MGSLWEFPSELFPPLDGPTQGPALVLLEYGPDTRVWATAVPAFVSPEAVSSSTRRVPQGWQLVLGATTCQAGASHDS